MVTPYMLDAWILQIKWLKINEWQAKIKKRSMFCFAFEYL